MRKKKERGEWKNEKLKYVLHYPREVYVDKKILRERHAFSYEHLKHKNVLNKCL